MSAARLLPLFERRAPKLAPRLKKWFVEYLVPANRAMGIRIVHIAADSSKVVLRLPLKKRNLNVGGTIHGGVILALAETVHGVAVLWQFPPADHRMVSLVSRIEFLAPARGPLTVRFGLTKATRARIAAALDAEGVAKVELESSVEDGSGTEVARLEATYLIHRRPGPAEAAGGG